MEDIKIIKDLSKCKKTNLLLNYFYGEFVAGECDFKSGINQDVLYCINSLGTRFETNIYI